MTDERLDEIRKRYEDVDRDIGYLLKRLDAAEAVCKAFAAYKAELVKCVGYPPRHPSIAGRAVGGRQEWADMQARYHAWQSAAGAVKGEEPV